LEQSLIVTMQSNKASHCSSNKVIEYSICNYMPKLSPLSQPNCCTQYKRRKEKMKGKG
jgi:hypothetical protein